MRASRNIDSSPPAAAVADGRGLVQFVRHRCDGRLAGRRAPVGAGGAAAMRTAGAAAAAQGSGSGRGHVQPLGHVDPDSTHALSRSLRRSAGSRETNRVFQNGWSIHAPSRACRCMPRRTFVDTGIFFSMEAIAKAQADIGCHGTCYRPARLERTLTPRTQKSPAEAPSGFVQRRWAERRSAERDCGTVAGRRAASRCTWQSPSVRPA
jgi:hypothetical protein